MICSCGKQYIFAPNVEYYKCKICNTVVIGSEPPSQPPEQPQPKKKCNCGQLSEQTKKRLSK